MIKMLDGDHYLERHEVAMLLEVDEEWLKQRENARYPTVHADQYVFHCRHQVGLWRKSTVAQLMQEFEAGLWEHEDG